MRAADRKLFVGKTRKVFRQSQKNGPTGPFFYGESGKRGWREAPEGVPTLGLRIATGALRPRNDTSQEMRYKPGGLQYLRGSAQDLGGGASGYGAAAAAVFH